MTGFAELTEEKIARAIAEGAGLVCERARELCPVDTGALRSSVNVAAEGMSAAVTADVPYAAYVEFGTSKSAAQPYLVPALLQEKEAVIARIAEVLSE